MQNNYTLLEANFNKTEAAIISLTNNPSCVLINLNIVYNIQFENQKGVKI